MTQYKSDLRPPLEKCICGVYHTKKGCPACGAHNENYYGSFTPSKSTLASKEVSSKNDKQVWAV